MQSGGSAPSECHLTGSGSSSAARLSPACLEGFAGSGLPRWRVPSQTRPSSAAGWQGQQQPWAQPGRSPPQAALLPRPLHTEGPAQLARTAGAEALALVPPSHACQAAFHAPPPPNCVTSGPVSLTRFVQSALLLASASYRPLPGVGSRLPGSACLGGRTHWASSCWKDSRVHSKYIWGLETSEVLCKQTSQRKEAEAERGPFTAGTQGGAPGAGTRAGASHCV